MKVIGVVGRNGSGKDALLDYLQERCALTILSAGDVARRIARDEGVPATRENLHQISTTCIKRYGEEFFMRRLVDQVQDDWHAVGITGIRTPADVRFLRETYGDDLVLVHVKVADPVLRFRRIRERDKERDPQSYEAFLQQDQEETELFDLDETIRRADLTIRNDVSLEAFYRRIRESIIEMPLGRELECQARGSKAPQD